MRSFFTAGLVHPKETAWMGQTAPQQVYAATVEDIIVQGLKSGSDAYGSYSKIEVAEAGTEGKEAEAAAKDAAARTAQIMQQTSAMQQAALSQQNKVMGMDKGVFFIGATLLGLAVVGGALYMVGKKK
jgi:hypothetical protein